LWSKNTDSHILSQEGQGREAAKQQEPFFHGNEYFNKSRRFGGEFGILRLKF